MARDGTVSGGRPKGSRNKAVLAREQAKREAVEKMLNADGSGAFAGDAHALLMAIYKNEELPIELRLDAAKSAIHFEKPALESIDSRIDDRRNYVVRMPPPIDNLENWKTTYGDKSESDEDPADHPKKEMLQ